MIVSLYVDNLIITSGDDVKFWTFKEDMKGRFLMSDLRTLSYYLGLEVH